MLPEGSHIDGLREQAPLGSDLKDVLLSQGQFAITAQRGFMFDVSSAQKEYELALIVTFGVDKNYFYDTAQDAVEYFHSGSDKGHFICVKDGPLFLRKIPDDSFAGDYNLTTGELAAQGGWPSPEEILNGKGYLPDPQWKTGAPPPGCTGWRNKGN